MFDDAYIELSDEEKEKFFSLLSAQLDGSPPDPALTRVYKHDLPFYKRWQIVEAEENQGSLVRRFAVVAPEQMEAWNEESFRLLDGTNKTIYALNEELPIHLYDDIVPLYIKFFFYHVRGAQGRFHVIENIEDILWHEEPAPSGKAALSKMISTIALKASNDEHFTAAANIIFKDSLFESDITVQKDGKVTLSNQEILVEDLPVKTEA